MSLALGALAGLGRNTITGMLCATGQQFKDWSAACRLFGKPRFDAGELFGVARRTVTGMLPPQAPLCVSIDDTHLRKSGKKVYGTAWKRDPLGPAFQTNLIWAQRFLQISACLPVSLQPGPATAVPIAFTHAPSPKKPKKTAGEDEWTAYKAACKEQNLCKVAAQHLKDLRDKLDAEGEKERSLWINGDGGYTNETILKKLPERTIFTGRIRKDAKLCYPLAPGEQHSLGRKRRYGSPAPTPEQLRQDESVPWQTLEAWAAGKLHHFRIKTLEKVQWRTAGPQILRVIVIAPLGYRLSKDAKLLYRQPAYLICTSPEQPLELVLQNYLWRWGIEANHREEKQLIGVGDAQVRTAAATGSVPAFLVAAYALLRLAARRAAEEDGMQGVLPPPLWNRRNTPQPACTTRAIQQLRAELWGKALGINFSGFAYKRRSDTKPQKCIPDLAAAVLYAQN